MKTTIHVAEERLQAYIKATKHAHLQEIENVRREAHNALHEQANRHAWETHVAATAAVVTTEANTADVARAARLRELELAFELQGNELATLQRVKESASETALAHARHWTANKSDAGSSGNANYHDISSGGSASQPGVLASLAMNVFGYRGAPSDTTTAAPTAAGYDGSQASLPFRSRFPINLYDPEASDLLAPTV